MSITHHDTFHDTDFPDFGDASVRPDGSTSESNPIPGTTQDEAAFAVDVAGQAARTSVQAPAEAAPATPNTGSRTGVTPPPETGSNPATREGRRWSPKKIVGTAVAAAVVVGGATVGILEATRDSDEAGPSNPAKTSTPFAPDTLTTAPSPIGPDTKTAVIVNPTTPAETAPATQSAQQETSSPSPTSEVTPAAFVLEPAPNANEYPEELQKYVVNQAQAEADPDHYWPAYAKRIGMEITPVSAADKAQIEEYILSPDTPAVNSVPFAQELAKYQGDNFNAYANALVNNRGLEGPVKLAMIKELIPYFTLNAENYVSNPADYYFLSSLNTMLAKLPNKSNVNIQIAACAVAFNNYPDNCYVEVTTNGQPVNLADSDAYLRTGDLRVHGSSIDEVHSQFLVR